MVAKIKKQNFLKLKDTHSDLHTSIQTYLKHLSDEDKGLVAGLVIEYVIKSNGDVDILEEELDFDYLDGDIDKF